MKKILLILMAFSFAFGVKAQQLDVNAAKQLVIKNAAEIGMTAADLADFRVSNAYTNEGAQMVYILQNYKGLPIFNQMRVLQFKNGAVSSNAGGFIPEISKIAQNSSASPKLNAESAVGFAFRETQLPAPSFLNTPVTEENGRKNNFGIVSGVSEDLTAELLWVPVTTGQQTHLKLAWQVMVASARADWWLVQVDANTGNIIKKISLTVRDSWDVPGSAGILKATPQSKKGTVSSGFFLPSAQTQTAANSPVQTSANRPAIVTNASYLVVAFPNGAPGSNGTVVNNPWTAAPGNATSLKWHNDAATDYTITRGNNVWATEDAAGTGSNNPPNVPATSSTGPDPLTFNFPPNYTVSPTNAAFQPFAITNLFYWNNIMHDVSYQYGFNEVSANFQTNNQGRGGAQNDNVRALAQSGAGTNNADFSAGTDGQRGQMRMFQFTGQPTLHVNAPAGLVGNYSCLEGAFSTANLLANVGPVTAPVAFFNDGAAGTHIACTPAATPLTGKIAFIYRGTCTFVAKVLAAQQAGAVGVIMVNNVPGALVSMAGADNSITIPAVFISDVDGAALADEVSATLNVTLSAGVNKDGDVVPDIMCHEYGHGISGRMTGGGTGGCLSNAEQGGEGWSDYFALMITNNWATATTADGPNPKYIGNYVAANLGYPAGGGIRNYPYSTNITTNPLTYAAIGLGAVAPWNYGAGTEVHNIGEVWCAAVWEMTWAIIQQENSINPNIYDYTTTGTGGNVISLKLVTEGLRLQPCGPGYIDARNAIMKADRNLYCGKHACAIWTAFAKRGMGQGSAQGSASSLTDQTSTTTMPPAPTVVTSPVSQSVAVGGNVTFTANAGTDVNLIYQWQVSTDGGTNWTDIPCQITSSLTLTAVTGSMNANQYRAKVYIACLSSNTAAATLTVTGASAPAITLTSAAATAAQTVCVNSAITSITYSTSGGVTGATVTGLPAGVTGVYTGTTNGTVTISGTPTAAGTFNYTVTTSGGSATATATGTITVSSNTTITLTSAAGTNNQTICSGSPITNIVYTIANGGTGASATGLPAGVTGTYAAGVFTISGTPTAGGTFNYTVTTSGGCGIGSLTGTIIVSALPAAPTVVSPVNYCQNAAAVPLTATGTNLKWYTVATGGVGSATAPTPSTAVIGTTTYYVSQTPGTCEGPRAAIVVNVTATTPAPTVTSPVTYCQNAAAVPLTATGTGLLWYAAASGGVGSATAPTPSTTTVGSTNYYVSQTTSCGEGPRAVIVVNVTAPPAAPGVTSPVTYCQGATATPLTATGSGLLWYTAATGGTGSATAPIPSTTTVGSTIYYVSQTVGCESPRAAITVTVNATPAAPTVTSPVTYCQNATATPLTATGTGLLWYTVATGGTGSATAPTPSTTTVGSTTYYVSQTTGSCESPRASITVNINAATTAPTVTSPVTYCQGATAVPLTATGTGLLWYTAATGGVGSATAPTPSTAAAGSTTYYVSQTGGCGEGPRASITVTVNALPAAPTVTSPVTYCQGSTATALTATGTGLLWYTAATGGTGSATAPTPSTATVGSTTYYVSQTTGTCEGPRAAIVVTINATPAAPTVTSPVNYCQGAVTVPLTATGTNLKWYTVATGGTGSATAPTPSSATVGSTTYYVSQTTGSCEGPRAAIVVNITTGAVITGQPVDITSCATSATFTVTATGSSLTYQWQVSTDGGTTYTNIPGATSASLVLNNLTPAQSGYKYHVVVTSAGCGAVTSNAVSAHVGTPPVVVLTAAPSTVYNPAHNGGLFTTVSPVGNYTYEWKRDGVVLATTGPSITAANGLLYDFGTYLVTVTDVATGCSGVSNSVTIVDIPNDRGHLFISPNPTNGPITVSYYSETLNVQNRMISVYDSKGAKLMTKEFTVSGRYGFMYLDLTGKPAGTYMIILRDAAGKKIAEGRVVKF